MTSSPPKPSSSSRPPAPSLDGGRLITAGAAGASVLLLSVTAVVLWPRTYGAEATIVLDGNGHIDNPTQLASRIEAALLEREVLATAAMDLPPELRSPDPIGRLRGGIRVQARDARGYIVEFRGSDPQSVQRIANRLADRAVGFVPKLATSPDDAAPLVDLAAKTRAVTEFLTAHPEMALEQSEKPERAQTDDRGLDLLFTEKRQIEQRLATGATDNPYADPGDDPAMLTRRLAEIKLTISRREAALKRAKTTPTAISPELTAEWRALLAQLADAQLKASRPTARPPVTARVASRANLPRSPLTPNRMVLSIVAVLLSVAAAMLAFVLPRKAATPHRLRTGTLPLKAVGAGEAPAAAATMPVAPGTGSEPPGARPSESPPARPSDPPAQGGSNPPPATGSEPPGPLAPMRTVVLSSSAPAQSTQASFRRRTSPGGVAAPAEAQLGAPAATVAAAAPPAPSAVPFGSRPPPGAGSYSVSSSHPPPDEGAGARTAVERLSPLHSQRPPAHSVSPPPAAPAAATPIVSRPPALDPEAERWAARFETPPPAVDAVVEDAPKRGGAGRWKTQVMGSMVPLEVQQARENQRPLSEPPPAFDTYASPMPQAPTPAASTLIHHEVPHGWRPHVDPTHPHIVSLRDAILKQGLARHLRVAVTSSPGLERAEVAGALALALSEAGARVLLLEADFDHPDVHRVMAVNAPSGAGFSQQIIGRRHAEASRPWVVVRCLPTLHVLAEGRLRSPGLLESREFDRAIRELGEQHHVLVLHAPALDKPTDLQTIDNLSQAAVLVQAKEAPSIQFGNNPLRPLL